MGSLEDALERCRSKLGEVGLTGRKLESVGLQEAGAITRQLVDELGLAYFDEIEQFVLSRIQAARDSAGLQDRSEGLFGTSFAWRQLYHGEAISSPAHVTGDMTVALPPRGTKERSRKRDAYCALDTTREEKEAMEREALCLRLYALLAIYKAPCLLELSSDLDSGRKAEVVAGRLRNGSLRRYLAHIEDMVLWMQRTKLRGPPYRAGDVVDFLFMLAEEPCGHTVPGSVLRALSWFEKASDLAPDRRTTAGRLVWSTKEVLTRTLSRPDRPVKRAPRLPGAMIVSLEILTMNDRESLGIRVGSFYRLLKCWGTLRHDDVQRICPQRVRFFGGRFSVVLSVSKTSGPDRRQVELPIAITEDSWLYERDWLQVGWKLLMDAAPFDRDYLIPALHPDFGAFRRRMASYSEISAMSAAVTRRLVTLEGSRLVPDELVELWTEHSERATLPTLLDGFGLDPRDRDALGRWRPEGSDTYMRSFSAKIKRIHRYLKSELEKQRLEGELDDHDVLEAAYDWLRSRRSMGDEEARRIVNDFRSALGTWQVQDADSPVSDEEQADDEQSDDTEPEASKATPRDSGFVLVTSQRGTVRLHRAGPGGCWMARARDFRNYILSEQLPEPSEYTHRCRLCWAQDVAGSSDESSRGSSDHDTAEEAANYAGDG